MRLHKGDSFRGRKDLESSSFATWYKMEYMWEKREIIRSIEMHYMKYVAGT